MRSTMLYVPGRRDLRLLIVDKEQWSRLNEGTEKEVDYIVSDHFVISQSDNEKVSKIVREWAGREPDPLEAVKLALKALSLKDCELA